MISLLIGALVGDEGIKEFASRAISTPTSSITATSEEDEVRIAFNSDRTEIQPGECVTFQWDIQGGYWKGFGRAETLSGCYYVDWQDIDPSGQIQVCPDETTRYTVYA